MAGSGPCVLSWAAIRPLGERLLIFREVGRLGGAASGSGGWGWVGPGQHNRADLANS